MEKISKLIWQIRVKGFSLKEISNETGIHVTNLSKYTRNEHMNPTIETYNKVKQMHDRLYEIY